MASYRAQADAVGFLSVGDMVLDDFAHAQLGRWSIAPGEYPWRELMRQVDALFDAEGVDGPHWDLIRGSRRLDLILRDARNRLVAHRVRDHHMLVTWDRDGSISIQLTGVEPDPQDVDSLSEIASRLRGRAGTATAGATNANFNRMNLWTFRDQLLAAAGLLSQTDRRTMKEVFKSSGYDSARLTTIVESVLMLIDAMTSASDSMPSRA